MAYSYSTLTQLNNLGEIVVPVVQCGNIICNDQCHINGNVTWNDCDASIAHIGNAYISNLEVNNVIANIPQAFGDHLVFYDTTTKQLSHNTGYYTQTLNVTWTISNYCF